MKLTYIEELIDTDGQITLGHMYPVGCVAIANDGSNTLAMLKRKPRESLVDLIKRLDRAIEHSIEHQEYIDEINQR